MMEEEKQISNNTHFKNSNIVKNRQIYFRNHRVVNLNTVFGRYTSVTYVLLSSGKSYVFNNIVS